MPEDRRRSGTMKLDVHTDQVSNLDEVRALVRARLSAEQRAVVGDFVMQVEVDRVIDPARLESLASGLRRVLGDVRAAVMDWKAMSTRLASVVAEIESHPPPIPPEEFSEGKDFLHWLGDNHFTFL